MMKRKIAMAAALIIVILIGTAPAFAQETIALKGKVYQSKLISSSCTGGVCDELFEGSGAVNIMGSTSWRFHVVQDFNTTPCSEFSGVMTTKGATGTITWSDAGYVCPGSNPRNPYTISGNWEIIGGTGEFEGITGSGSDQGVIGGSGPMVHYTGTVSY
jgi:hypothetical protein